VDPEGLFDAGNAKAGTGTAGWIAVTWRSCDLRAPLQLAPFETPGEAWADAGWRQQANGSMAGSLPDEGIGDGISACLVEGPHREDSAFDLRCECRFGEKGLVGREAKRLSWTDKSG